MHANFFRIGGLSKEISLKFLMDLYAFILDFYKYLDEFEELLSSNSIWRIRLSGVGVISKVEALSYSSSGIILRECILSLLLLLFYLLDL